MDDIRGSDELVRSTTRFALLGLLASCLVVALGACIERFTPRSIGKTAWVVLQLLGAALRGFGFGFGVFFLLLFAAGFLGITFSRRRKAVALALLIAAVVGFLFVPICWNPKSDDCRTTVQRAEDLLRG